MRWVIAVFVMVGCGGSSKAPSAPGTKPGAPKGVCGGGDFSGCASNCAGGDGQSCMILGLGQAMGQVPGGEAAAQDSFERGCQLKSSTACENLGTALANGWKGAPDVSRAFGYQQEACDLGSRNGCFNLANYHLAGVGTAKDAAKGFTILRTRVCDIESGKKPTDTDDIIAQLKGCKMVGMMTVTGTGTAPNPTLGRTFLNFVCNVGKRMPAGVNLTSLKWDEACATVQQLDGK